MSFKVITSYFCSCGLMHCMENKFSKVLNCCHASQKVHDKMIKFSIYIDAFDSQTIINHPLLPEVVT